VTDSARNRRPHGRRSPGPAAGGRHPVCPESGNGLRPPALRPEDQPMTIRSLMWLLGALRPAPPATAPPAPGPAPPAPPPRPRAPPRGPRRRPAPPPPAPPRGLPRGPPPPIEELPPELKPEGDDVVWVPGYWDWDEDSADFVWVSGFWREPPPGRDWVPGFW